MIEYSYFQGLPDPKTLKGVLALHKHVFDDSELLILKLEEKDQLIIFVATSNEEVVGFKIGYRYSEDTFYSWLGGVHTIYRGQGIAKELMLQQHELIKELGYKKVRTISRNVRREMLILNIKTGFDVIETFVSNKGKHKIVLEKVLL